MLGGRTFKPKEARGSLPVPATFNNIKHIQKKRIPLYIIVLVLFVLYLNPLRFSFSFSSKSQHKYPSPHPYTSPNIITTSSRYIFPPVEHARLLQELGRSTIVKESRVRDAEHPEIDVSNIFSLNKFDDPNPAAQLAKEKEENMASELSKAKNVFKNADKIVYKPKILDNYPEVVVVTAIDYEKYSIKGLTSLVQNRVDYAHQHGYGVYVRWYQEFLPWMGSFSRFDESQKRKWIRVFAMRAAMFAFPQSKWFWYLDEDGFIMELNINLQDYILKPEALAPVMLREQPIDPRDGIIKTYKLSLPKNVKLIVTQSDDKVETNSYIMRNDDLGKAILEFWTTELFLDYSSFPFGLDSALTHILQWHPFCLSRAAIIPARTMAARHNGQAATEGDHLHYMKGDLAATWSSCTDDCEKILDSYVELAKSK